MNAPKTILLTTIRTDGGTQARTTMDREAIEEYAAAMTDGATFPPVTVFQEGKEHWLADGFHRLEAARKAGLMGIPADVRPGSLRDAKLWAAGANADHGIRRTTEDKRKAVGILLADGQCSSLSDRELAKACRVSHPFVAKVRKKVEGGNVSNPPTPPRSKLSTPGPAPKLPSEQAPPTSKPILDVGCPVPEARTQVESQPLEGECPTPHEMAADMADLLQASMDENKILIEEIEQFHRVLDAEDLLGAYKKEVTLVNARIRAAYSRVKGTMEDNFRLAKTIKARDRKIDQLEKLLKENGLAVPKREPWQKGYEQEKRTAPPPMTEDDWLFDDDSTKEAS